MTLLFAQVAWSRHLSPDEALGRLNDTSMSKIVSNKSGGSSRHELVRSVKAPGSTEADIYLFSDNAKRLVVLPADDNAPALLGYVDRQENAQESDVLPPAFEWWLEQYAAQIRYAQANPGAMAAAPAADRAPIDYMVKTRWNQSYPYNAQCPVFSNGQQAVTGCVATAFAQVMNYHQWPEQGRGSISYNTNSVTSYSMDFSEVTFDWASMLDEYDSEADKDSASVQAVSALMKACGYSVRMMYGANESGAWTGYIVDSAPEYFDYADEMYYAERRNYSSAQWEDLVYGQLAQGLPLIYSGRDGNWSNSAGHCFICDGYDGDGYYHFNWGWGGYCDGWFLLSALVPEGVGIGGAAGGYDYSQSLIVNFHPSSTTIVPSNGYVSRSMRYSSYDKTVYADVTPERQSLAPSELNFGLEFLSEGRSVLVVDLGSTSQDYRGEYSPQYKLQYDVLNGMGLEDGTYDIRFVYKEAGEWKMLMWGYNHTKSLTIDLNPEDIAISETERISPVVISDVDFNGRGIIIKNCANELTFTATNTSDEAIHWMSWQHLVRVGETVPGQEVYTANLDLLPGESRKISLTIPANSIRNYGSDTEYYFMFRGGEEGGNIIYANQDVTYRVVDPATDGISDGIFNYLEVGDGALLMTGLASGVSKLSGDVILPDQAEINGTQYQISSMVGQLPDLLDVQKVTSLDIRTPIKEIPAETFEYCQNLKSISFPSTLEKIGDYAFLYCQNMAVELKLPESLTYIGNGAFWRCDALSGSLVFPSSVKYIGGGAFFNCYRLNGTVTLPSGLTRIENSTFAYCYYLNGPLEIPSSVTYIGAEAFAQCMYFTGSLVIPSGVTSIGEYAFAECEGITDVTMLPDNVPSIGEDAFVVSDKTVAPKKFYVAAGAGAPYREALSGYSDDVYELGDANLSKSLTVADAVAVVNEIIGAPNETFDIKCGDINRDGRISISDATTVVSCVLKYNPGGIAESSVVKVSSPAAGRIIADSSNADEVALRLDGVDDVVAIQADVFLDGSLDLDDIRLADSLKDTHTLQVARLADGSVRMIVFSLSNAQIALNGAPVAYIGVEDDIDASAGLQLANIVAVSADASERFIKFDNAAGAGLACDELAAEKAQVSIAGGMLSVSNAAGALVKVYDLSGRLIMSFRPDSDAAMIQLDKGVYMISVNDREAVKIIL
ncbi:MAG: C10 family peptidase [Muribaculaceae bacterium]|nr:C10 family peptidase [Muribaculaceae bacterium]